MMRIGVVGISGGWSSEQLANVVEEKTGFRLLVEMDRVYFDSLKDTCFFEDFDLLDLDALIIKKIGARYSPDHLQRLEMLRYIEGRGLKIFSKPQNISRCLDRLSCTLTLRQGEIPMPATMLTEDVEKAEEAVRLFGRAVFKPLFTSKARGMKVFQAEDKGLRDDIAAFKILGNSVMYIQKMIDIPGRDLGVTFLKGKYVSTYARVTNGDSWNTTTVNGGRYEAVEPSPEIITLAERAQALFGLDFTGVDVVETQEGPMVFEVSALGGFRGLWEAHRINMAEMIADHVLENLRNGREK